MPFAHTHREDFSKKNGVCQLFSRRFTGICRNLSISGKIKPSPWGEGVCDSRRMRGAAYNAKPIFDFLNILGKISEKSRGSYKTEPPLYSLKFHFPKFYNFILPFFDFAVIIIVPIVTAFRRFFCAVIISRCAC